MEMKERKRKCLSKKARINATAPTNAILFIIIVIIII